MKHNFYLIDAFTNVRFKGNPAGVCILNEELPEYLMLKIANEIGVSETAFFSCNNNRLRWFTPRVEIALCGHATLAAMIAINDLGLIDRNEKLEFKTKSGDLIAHIDSETVTMDFPIGDIPVGSKCVDGIIESLGIDTDVVFYGKSGTKTIIEVSDVNEVVNLKPDYAKLLNQDGYGIIVTAMATGEYDFLSRYFHPWAGVNEDPVTGSAHCILASYYQEKLKKNRMIGYQASSRGGVVVVEIKDEGRVNLIGSGAIVVRGNI